MVLKGMSIRLYDSLRDLRCRVIKELIEPPLVTDADTNISKIIGILTENNGYEVFIQLKDKDVIGINIRDILSTQDISTAKISILGKRIPVMTGEENIGYAARIMSLYRLRTLPVIHRHNKDIIGQISAKDIIKSMHESFITSGISEGIKIVASDIMTPNPVTLTSKDRVSTAKGIMSRHKIDHLPIVEKKDGSISIKGILTSSHILEIMFPSERIGKKSFGIDNIRKRLGLSVVGLLEKDVKISNVDDAIQDVCNLMLKTNSTYTIVKSVDEIQGIITYRDIISLLGEKVEYDIPAFLIGLPDDPLDAELAKSKFINLVKLLRNVSSDIEEARCRMKLSGIQGGGRRRYEVDINILTPSRRLTYTTTGWDLPRLFDECSDSLKNQLAHRKLGKQKESIRHLTE
jgi:CBS domain-containing protein